MELLARTRIVLHHPFFPENVGAVARAMRNTGLTQLHIAEGVTPDHPGARPLAVASGHILDTAVYNTCLEDALQGVTTVLGTTSHPFPHLRVMTPREAAAMARDQNGTVALVFGNEKNGLSIHELRRCDGVIRIPSPIADASLNLAQAVMVVCYEWMLAAQSSGPPDPLAGWRDLASNEETQAMLDHLENLLRRNRFYKPHNEAQRRSVLRRIAARLQLDREEVSILRGLVSKLAISRQSLQSAQDEDI